MFLRGFLSDLTTLWPCSARYWMNISCRVSLVWHGSAGARTVATAMVNVALLEHCAMSSSSWMIFFIRDTRRSAGNQRIGGRTGKSSLAGDFIWGLGGVFGRHDQRTRKDERVYSRTSRQVDYSRRDQERSWRMKTRHVRGDR